MLAEGAQSRRGLLGRGRHLVRRVPQVSDVGIAVHGKTGARSVAPEPGSMKRKGRHVDDVTFLGDDGPYLLNGITDVALA